MLLVEPLRRAQSAAGREPEERVGVTLQGGEVVQKLRALALLLLLELRDLAAAVADLLDDPRREILRDALAAQVAAAVRAALVGRERGLHEPVRLGLEGADLLLAASDERERGGLHPSERHRSVERRAQPDRCGSGGVHPHHPVRLRPRPGGRLELAHLGAGTEVLERLLDRLARHRREPQALDGLVYARRLVEVGEDQLAFAAGVARVNDQLDVVVAHQLVHRLELLLRALVDRDELELLRDDRQIGEAPALELGVVLVRSRKADQVADGPRDHELVAIDVGLVLALLEVAGERGREVAAHRGLLSYDECLGHWARPTIRGASTLVHRGSVLHGSRDRGQGGPGAGLTSRGRRPS